MQGTAVPDKPPFPSMSGALQAIVGFPYRLYCFEAMFSPDKIQDRHVSPAFKKKKKQLGSTRLPALLLLQPLHHPIRSWLRIYEDTYHKMPAAAEIQRVAGPLDFDVQHRTQLNPTTHAKTVALEVKNLPADAHVPSSQKIVPGSYKIPAGVFPQSPWSFPDANVVASKLVERLNKALKEKVADNIGVLFHENSYWRDHLCFTWDLRTLKEPEGISHFVSHSSESVSIAIDASTPFRAPKYGPLDGLSGESSNSSGILFFVNVTTKAGAGRGVAKLAEVQGQWKFFTIFTTLEKLHGHEEHLGKRRPNGAHHGAHVGRQNWKDRRDAAVEFQEREPAVLIVGM